MSNARMKWKYYHLSADDEKAMAQIVLNLRSGNRALGRKLLSRFCPSSGGMFAIAMENLDVSSLADYDCATYCGGKQWTEATGITYFPAGDGPIDGLISFLLEFLRLNRGGAIVIGNWISKRTDPHMSPETRATFGSTSRLAFFGAEVYHIVTPEEADPEVTEDAIREPWHRWFVGVCAARLTIPDDNELSTELLDELVDKTEHIFVPAFDDEGFLVWSPKLSGNPV